MALAALNAFRGKSASEAFGPFAAFAVLGRFTEAFQLPAGYSYNTTSSMKFLRELI